MIVARQVSKRYGKVQALSGVSFEVGGGEVLLLLGANGAGKSTLVRSILGVTDYRGSIRVAGLDPLSSGKAVRSRIGYMPQSGGLHLDLTVDETMRFYAALRRVPRQRGDELLALVGLGAQRRTRVGDLSGGMRQRLGFAVALLSDPPVLLLDEPTASLDARSRELLARHIRGLADAGKAVVLSTHSEIDLACIADRALRLEEGRLVS